MGLPTSKMEWFCIRWNQDGMFPMLEVSETEIGELIKTGSNLTIMGFPMIFNQLEKNVAQGAKTSSAQLRYEAAKFSVCIKTAISMSTSGAQREIAKIIELLFRQLANFREDSSVQGLTYFSGTFAAAAGTVPVASVSNSSERVLCSSIFPGNSNLF